MNEIGQVKNNLWQSLNLNLPIAKNLTEIIISKHSLNSSFDLRTESFTKDKHTEGVFACSFCQAFAPCREDVICHIKTDHSNSLHNGGNVGDFVLHLRALSNQRKSIISGVKNETVFHDTVLEKIHKKRGRPKKIPQERKESKVVILPTETPVAREDGLYWCKTCKRHFVKSRQLISHICRRKEEDVFLHESSGESDDELGYHSYFDAVSACKPLKRKSPTLSTEDSTGFGKIVIPNWREDPEYVPLFCNDRDKEELEEHIKSVDFHSIDRLFMQVEKKCRSKLKSVRSHTFGTVYSCNYCTKTLTSLDHIRMHCLTHTELRPFTCPRCSYSSNSKGSLYAHFRVHLGSMFRCSQCSFQTIRRAHLLEHLQTHSSIPQICKICKNNYKTLKSLMLHVKNYHDTQSGRSYLNHLKAKPSRKAVTKCNKSSRDALSLDTQQNECAIDIPLHKNSLFSSELQYLDTTNASEQICAEDPQQDKCSKYLTPVVVLKDILADGNKEFLATYLNEFPTSTSFGSELFTNPPLIDIIDAVACETFPSNEKTHKSLLDCEKSVGLDILEDCLKLTEEACDPVSVVDIAEMELDYSTESLTTRESLSKIDLDLSGQIETVSEEIKLFEKCRRAPAYVCCVCSGIYICPVTLKAHLREHVSTSLVARAMEFAGSNKELDANMELENVCSILGENVLDTPECSQNDLELEKLYSSSLDKMWYLPEVSVVLQNDPNLFDMNIDLTDFPIDDEPEVSSVGKDNF